MTLTRKNYAVHFDFTTVHSGGRFVGRNGELTFSTDAAETIEEINKNEVEQLCMQAIKIKNQKWHVFMIEIKSISPV